MSTELTSDESFRCGGCEFVGAGIVDTCLKNRF